jgi:hypothetical protein
LFTIPAKLQEEAIPDASRCAANWYAADDTLSSAG